MFEIGLQVIRNLDDFSLDDYLAARAAEETEDEAKSHALDSTLGLTSEICDRFHDLKVGNFVVRGFGLDPWKVDVWYDLSTIIKQFPELLEWIDNDAREVFELDFFAQGTERSLFFRVKGDQVEIECKSRTDWQPDLQIEMTDIAAIDRMFSQVLTTFVSESRKYFPDLIETEYFKEWDQIPAIKRRLYT